MITERELESPDPLRLDREVRELAGRVRKWRRALRLGADLDGDPFQFARLLAGRAAFHAVLGLDDGDALKRPLARFIYRLAEQRIDGTALVRCAVERGVELHVVSEPERSKSTLLSVLDRALSDGARRDAWLSSYLARAQELSTAVSALWERRAEVASRMGAPSLDAIEGIGMDPRPIASEWLDRTDDMLEELAPRTLGDLVRLALAPEAGAAFPRHLVPRTILDLFRGSDLFRDVDLDPGALPSPYGAASFSRALCRVGAAWATALAPADQPFVVAHDPYGLGRRSTGALFAALPGSAPFAKRALELDASHVPDHVRTLGAALLVESRKAALRVLLRSPALEGRRAFAEAFESGVVRAFGVPVSPEAAGALFSIHADDAQRFAGLLLAAERGAALSEAHDEDWYRNPRAIEQLRDEARLPPSIETTANALKRGAAALYSSLAAALG